MTWLTALVRPKTSTEAARAALLLWNPVIACAVAFASGGARVLAGSTAIVILIADLVVLQCLAGAYALGKCEVAFRRRLGGLERVPSTGSQFFFAGSLIPLALPSAFAAGGVVGSGGIRKTLVGKGVTLQSHHRVVNIHRSLGSKLRCMDVSSS